MELLGCVGAGQAQRLRRQGEPCGTVGWGGGGGRRGAEGAGASSPVSGAGEGVGVGEAREAGLRGWQEAVVFFVLLLEVGAGTELAELEREAVAAVVGQRR